jgi:hypothetical protein
MTHPFDPSKQPPPHDPYPDMLDIAIIGMCVTTPVALITWLLYVAFF